MATQNPPFGGGFTGDPNTSIIGGGRSRRGPILRPEGNFGAAFPSAPPQNVRTLPPNARELGPANGLSTENDQSIPGTSIDLPDLGWYERPEYLDDWRNLAAAFQQNRMDPSYTSFSPEARRALDRDIGRRHETTRQAISTDLRGRGLGGSGIEAQLRSDAAGAASAQAGDVLAQLTMFDEDRRAAAAQSLESMYRFGTGEGQFQQRREDEFNQLFLGTTGEAGQGPPIELPDMIAFLEVQAGFDQFRTAVELMLSEGQFSPADIAEAVMSTLPPSAWTVGKQFIEGLLGK